MKMTFRWFGEGFDSVTLEQIRQIPGMKGVITTLYDTRPGDAWDLQAIKDMKKKVEDADLELSGIESVNIHDAIKIGSPDRDRYIANYITTLERLGSQGINMICYNFMPVFDWTRTNLAKERPDGSTVLAYDQNLIDQINPTEMFERLDSDSNGFILPGWEPERMTTVKELFRQYSAVDNDIPDIIRSLKGRIHFAHVRNTKNTAPGVFEEAAHYQADGSVDMYGVMKALVDIGFDGPIRPDHGRMIWGEVSMPGYGLYDRALGSQYLLGLYDAIVKGRAH